MADDIFLFVSLSVQREVDCVVALEHGRGLLDHRAIANCNGISIGEEPARAYDGIVRIENVDSRICEVNKEGTQTAAIAVTGDRKGRSRLGCKLPAKSAGNPIRSGDCRAGDVSGFVGITETSGDSRDAVCGELTREPNRTCPRLLSVVAEHERASELGRIQVETLLLSTLNAGAEFMNEPPVTKELSVSTAR